MEYNYPFIDWLKKHKKDKNIRLFFDIETLMFNIAEAEKKDQPTLYKNVTYSVAVSYYEEEQILVSIFRNFYELFENIKRAFYDFRTKKVTGKNKITLIAHNNNKYDNHFLLKDLLYYYPEMKRTNMYMKNALENTYSYKEKELSVYEKEQGVILEKRVKSSNNLDMIFYLYNIRFDLIDNLDKTKLSIATLGKKLLKLNLITEDELKTSFDYTRFDLKEDMTDREAHVYAEYVFSQLNNEDLTYIRNDVIILGKSVNHYEKLFPRFDYSQITFTKNILDSYNNNPLSSFQLLNDYYIDEEDDRPFKLKYTDYEFDGENFYDWLKSFYRGGLNFYNPKYVAKLIQEWCFSMDRNSSYPDSMEYYKIPTFMVDFKSFNNAETTIHVNTDDHHYFLYRMTKQSFNTLLLSRIESDVFKKMLVKYYTTNDYVNINTYTIKLIEDILHIKIDKLDVISFVKYECVYFGSRDQIAEYYYIKSQGKLKNKLVMKTPRDYVILPELNNNIYTPEEIDNVKVMMNGLYGMPALKAYFNLFRLNEDQKTLFNVPNGYKNNERNLLFSTFVTSVSFYNLLLPLKYLTQKEIDDNFIYCDTDSLYLKNVIRHKIPDNEFDPIALGKWDIENEHISEFYVLNHKKYCYYSKDKKNGKEKGVSVRCGGIPLDSFNPKNYDNLKDFVEKEFHVGKKVKNKKSIYTKYGTIAIYPSYTDIDKGKDYPMYFNNYAEKEKKDLLEMIREDLQNGLDDDVLFIETEYGTFSQSDIFPKKQTINNKKPLIKLKQLNYRIKMNLIEWGVLNED